MASHKILKLLALLLSCLSVNGQFYFPQYHRFTPYASQHYRGPSWTSGIREPYEVSPSEQYSRYATFSRPHDHGIAAESPFEEPADLFLASSTKKVPREDKNFKKLVSPFYTISEKDTEKYKQLVLKSGVPYCEEIKGKQPIDGKDGKMKDSMICYKCKDLKNGATYEQCQYSSGPTTKSASTKNEEFTGIPSIFRFRRSNPKDSKASSSKRSSFEDSQNQETNENPYRFRDDIIADLTQDIPVEYRKKDEKCERVIKDSMICMVCEDSKTNGKYEQCTYSRKPAKKAYLYSKASSFKNPDVENTKPVEEPGSDERNNEESEETKEQREFSYPAEKYQEEAKQDKIEDATPQSEETSTDCQKIQKDSKTCTVCKDPKNGGTYEKCSYSYNPNDKVYKFSRSKSFGEPQTANSGEAKSSDYKDDSPAEEIEKLSKYTRDYRAPASSDYEENKEKSNSYYENEKPSSNYRQASFYDFSPSFDEKESRAAAEYVKSESEKLSENIDPNNCKKVQRDSMVCTVCKDPKTGSDSEKCAYSYEPADKGYSYSNSKSFGSPTKIADDSGEEKESKESRSYPYQSSKSYEFPSEKELHVDSSKKDYQEYPSTSETKSIAKKQPTDEKFKDESKASRINFYDTQKKNAQIEKFLQEFQKEDHSNCKKVMRDKMTCYRCVDEKGFQKEECALITTEDGDKDEIAYREDKEYEIVPAKKIPRSTDETKKPERRVDEVYMEPMASASENIDVKSTLVPEDNGGNEKRSPSTIEPYDTVAETKPVFDKVLGFSLPAYMLDVSDHEAEFDRVLKSGRL